MVHGTSDDSTRSWNVHSVPEPTVSAESRDSDMLILGQMIAGVKTFENLKKYTGLSDEKLDSILQDLESRQMIRVGHKQGIMGPKVELHPTGKGLREFHN